VKLGFVWRLLQWHGGWSRATDRDARGRMVAAELTWKMSPRCGPPAGRAGARVTAIGARRKPGGGI
jgi:hypothetical protein